MKKRTVKQPKLSFTQDYNIIPPAKQDAYYVIKTDWNRIKYMVSKLNTNTGGWINTFWGCSGLSLGFLLAWLPFPNNIQPTKDWLFWGFIILGVIALMSFIFSLFQRETEIFTKSQILKELETIEPKNSEVEKT